MEGLMLCQFAAQSAVSTIILFMMSLIVYSTCSTTKLGEAVVGCLLMTVDESLALSSQLDP